VNINYTARRDTPLLDAETQAIENIVGTRTVEKHFASMPEPKARFNGERQLFVMPPFEGEPDLVFAGSTVLPSSSLEHCWFAVRLWCEVLGEIRGILPNAEWNVDVDEHRIDWNTVSGAYTPEI